MSVGFCITAIALFLCGCFPQSAYAQVVTWTKTDINTGSTGSYTYTAASPPSYSISATGTGVGFIDDSYTFVSTPAFGAMTLQGKVVSQTNTGAGALAGLCIRDGSQQSYSYAYVLAVTPSNGISFNRRFRGGGNSTIATVAGTAPTYLKLTRDGSVASGYTVNAYSSSDGINWTLVGTAGEPNTSPMPNRFYAGFVVSSTTSGGTASTAVFDHVSYQTSVPQTSANMLCWLRSDVGVTTSAGAVTQWNDQSGNSNNATQSTAGLRPTLSSGTANTAILSSITFNGSQYLTLPTDFANLTSGFSAFVMLKPSSSVATGTPFVCGNTGPTDAAVVKTVGTNAALYAYSSTTSSNVTTSSNPISTSSFQLLETVFTPGSSPSTGVGKVYVGGTLQATSSTLVQTLANTSRATNRIGVSTQGTEFFSGDICEIIIYSNSVTDTLRHQIESYFLSKYNVGATPTLDAPAVSPSAGTYLPQQSFMLSQPQDAVVYFRTDGVTPTGGDSDFWFYNNQSFFLNNVSPEFVPKLTQTSVIKAIGKAPFFNDSPVTTATFTMDTSTAPIPRSGLVQWQRASDVTTSGSNVTSWQDLSGNSNNATNASNQPTLVANAINGLPAVNFSGTQFLQMPAGMANFTSGMTAIVVAKASSVTAGARIFDFGNGATSDNVLMSLPSSTGLTFSTYNGSTASSATASSGVTLGQFQLMEAFYNGSNTATLYDNGTQVAQSTTMQTLNNLTRSGNYLGQSNSGANRFNGQIAELLIWNRQLTTTERLTVEGYLLGKYQALSANSVTAPTLSVATSTLSQPSQVAIAGPDQAKIFFTIDGSAPSTSSNSYTGPINVMWTQTLKAIAVLNGISSSVSSATYTLDSTKWPAPSASDTRTLNLEQQLPNVGIPHDANQP